MCGGCGLENGEIVFHSSLLGSVAYLHSALNGTSLSFCPLEGDNLDESKLTLCGFSL